MKPPPKKKIIDKKFVIQNKLGLHARPAALLVQTANRFTCDIEVRKGRQKVDGKSIMGIMMLAVGQNSAITIRTIGADADFAMAEISKLIERNFGE